VDRMGSGPIKQCESESHLQNNGKNRVIDYTVMVGHGLHSMERQGQGLPLTVSKV
jgi:hypothetical protein